jgi:uncharacterized coiled-coil protein SlyX
MGDNHNDAAIKVLIDGLVADLNKQFEAMKDQFANLDNRLRNVEQGGHTDEAAAAAQAKREREAAANTLEADTRHAMEAAGRAFLKEKEIALSSTIPKLVDEVTNKLFDVNTNKEEAPKTTLPPPYPYQGHHRTPSMPYNQTSTSYRSPRSTARTRCHGLIAVSNSSEARRPRKVWYASFHLTGGA